LVALLFWIVVSSKKEILRLKTNADIVLRQELDRQQTITKKEFKKYFSEISDTLKSYGIKANQVQNIVQVKYIYKDTLIPKYVLNFRDSIIEYYDTSFVVTFSEFDVESKCNIVHGYILSDTLVIQSVETNDKVLISLYREKMKCLFKKRGIRAIAISECKGDTLEIIKNLKIGKK